MEIKETSHVVNDWFEYIFILIWIICIVSFLIFSGWLLYSEFKLEKSIVDETYKHNGTCVNKFPYRICSYQGDSYSVINSKCFKNDVEINCSDVER